MLLIKNKISVLEIKLLQIDVSASFVSVLCSLSVPPFARSLLHRDLAIINVQFRRLVVDVIVWESV